MQVFYVLQLFCIRCGIPVFASVLVKDGRKKELAKQIPFELTKQDLLRISPQRLQTDDVVEFSQFIQKHKGSLSDLIK